MSVLYSTFKSLQSNRKCASSKNLQLNGVITQEKKSSEIPRSPKLPNAPKIQRDIVSVLPTKDARYEGKKTLVLDLDETLVHSSFQRSNNRPDISLPVTIDKK